MNSGVLIIGRLPQPTGGVSIHVSRALYWLKQNNIEPDFYDLRFFSILPFLMKVHQAKKIHLHTSNPFLRFFLSIICFALFKKLTITYHGDLGRWGFIGNLADSLSIRLCALPLVLNDKSYILAKKLNKQTALMSAFLPPAPEEKVLQASIAEAIKSKRKTGAEIFCTNASHVTFDHQGHEIYGITELIKLFAHEENKVLIISDSSATYGDYLNEKGIKLPENVLLVSEEHSFVAVMQECSVLLRCTSTDGDSISVREGLYCGLRVIASDCVSRPSGVELYETFNWSDLTKKINSAGRTSTEKQLSEDELLKKLLTIYKG